MHTISHLRKDPQVSEFCHPSEKNGRLMTFDASSIQACVEKEAQESKGPDHPSDSYKFGFVS